ncbi:MAG TPA: FGGY family carbohydrate kinase [Bacteroidales bacterium]|nr:FGGY family carbohydrate kinase [Bacteroidales bacterium]
MKETAIVVFDIGKTNKKVLLFNEEYRLISETEQKFPEIPDDDGFLCDDIEHIESWIRETLISLLRSDKYDIRAVNFTTYGATIVYLDKNGKRLTPVYNYLKPMDEKIQESLYKRYGGRDEFCRRTASPALGMLNSGIQVLWLKSEKPGIYAKVNAILHFPQYLSYTLTGKIFSEHTSIGCHTALWDFDMMRYHSWTENYGLNLPEPVPVTTLSETEIDGRKINIGIGIHDSSASLAPYFSGSQGKFILLSTGTWCISMNPFNNEILTAEELDNDCLCYMSISMRPVKSSRLFLGYLHEEALKIISAHFGKATGYYKKIKTDRKLSDAMKEKFRGEMFFFSSSGFIHELKENIDMYVFSSFDEAYQELMNELAFFTIGSIRLILPGNDDTRNIYITGGFSKNEIFVDHIVNAFPSKQVWVSEIANASALGAALVVSGSGNTPNLGLTRCTS